MDKIFGERLRQLRKSNNMTQKELSEKLGISASAVGMYEQSRREPDSNILSGICNIFGVSVDYLLGRENSKSTELTDAVDDIVDKLLKQRCLMYNGKPVDKKDMKQIAEAIRIAAEFAIKYQEKRNG